MAQQLSLFGSPEPEEAPVKPKPAAASAQSKPAPEPPAAYASVVLDIPTRALSEPFAYGIPESLANEVQIGSTVLVHFGNRAAAGYVVDIAPDLGDLPGNNALDPVRIKPIEAQQTALYRRGCTHCALDEPRVCRDAFRVPAPVFATGRQPACGQGRRRRVDG